MPLKETIVAVRQHLAQLARDLEKAAKGNRTAAQRVRTESVKFAKTAKLYRKESLLAEKRETKRKK